MNNPHFGAVIFRRSSKQIRAEGGLWDESVKLYTQVNAHPRSGNLDWRFASGMRVSFAYLEYDSSVHNWHGSQIAMIGFDELQSFTQYQFFYMLSRNRSPSGVPGYVRATCNPDADSWLRKFIDWWINEKTGFPIKERSGVLRWFVRISDVIHWASTKEELLEKFGSDCFPLSVTFISASIYDNQELLKVDPSYIAKLKAMGNVERQRLLDGNWNIRATAGTMFRREWFPVVDAIPAGFVSAIRFWDRAATKVSEVNHDPDWTRGLLLYKYPDNTFVVADLRSLRGSPGEVENLIKNTASHDGVGVRIMAQQDPGSAGVGEAQAFTKMLIGYDVKTAPFSNNKVVRAKPVSAQAEAGNIKVLRAAWNDDFFSELENFPDGAHDDIVDTLSGAFNELSIGLSILDTL